MTFFKTKTLFSAALMLTLAAPVAASAQSSSALSALYACESVVNTEAQLACFLTETAKLRAVETSSGPAAVVVPQKQPVAETQPVAKADSKKSKKAKTPKKRTVAIRSAVKHGGRGYYRFTLENGEVWQQTQPERVRLGDAKPDQLTIKKGAFGSYLATVNGKGRSIRVRQVN